LGVGVLGFGVGGVVLGARAPTPTPQTPNPQSPIPNPLCMKRNKIKKLIYVRKHYLLNNLNLK